MTDPPEVSSPPQDGVTTHLSSGQETEDPLPRNMLSLIAHQVVFRIAWIFKTESVVMPAFLDSLTDSGWIRGMLPPLNRFGQSIPPLLLADRMSGAALKRKWLQRSTFLLSVPFLSLGCVTWFLDDLKHAWLPVFFLLMYGIFFCVHGVNQSCFNTIQGKLVPPNRRGRLMAISGYIGSPLAIVMAWLLLRKWTSGDPPQFDNVFLFTGTAFLLASVAPRFLVETSDTARQRTVKRRHLRDVVGRLRRDARLRRLSAIAALFVSSQVLFPHYQRIGREMPEYSGTMLMTWVIVQNLGAAVFSWISGRLADRRGTRSALRWIFFGAVLTPLIPLLIQRTGNAHFYFFTFFWLGLIPVGFRMQLSYVLEITKRENHPVYVSTVVVCMAPPIMLSPLVGELVNRFGYTAPFCVVSVVILMAWLLTLWMEEPRASAHNHETGS